MPVVGINKYEGSESDDEEEGSGNDNISLMSANKGGEIPDLNNSVQQLLKESFAPPPEGFLDNLDYSSYVPDLPPPS